MSRILIVDDHPVVRQGLGHILSLQKDLEVCGEADSVDVAIEMVEQTDPDLVLTDLSFPGRSGLELVKDLKSIRENLPVIVMSMHDEMLYAERVLKAGGKGYLMKGTTGEQLLEVINQVLSGKVYASPAVMDHLLYSCTGVSESSKAAFPLERLSDRELEIFELVGNGKSSKEIGEQLKISPRTVDVHRSNILKKIGLTNSYELVLYAVRWIESGKVL
ncbi:MAG: response regulator transcription factor [Verrucomicrobiales bacterium]|nr:response regulator transcription factor [Verrucomicrobiales bacterium]